MKARNQIIIVAATLMLIMSPAVFHSLATADDKAERQERHLSILKERLDLSDGQVNEIRAIMEAARLKAEKDREKFRTAGDREGARNAAEARRLKTDEKIKAVLNEKQKKEYDKIKDELRERKEKRGDRQRGRRGGMRGGGRGPKGNR